MRCESCACFQVCYYELGLCIPGGVHKQIGYRNGRKKLYKEATLTLSDGSEAELKPFSEVFIGKRKLFCMEFPVYQTTKLQMRPWLWCPKLQRTLPNPMKMADITRCFDFFYLGSDVLYAASER